MPDPFLFLIFPNILEKSNLQSFAEVVFRLSVSGEKGRILYRLRVSEGRSRPVKVNKG